MNSLFTQLFGSRGSGFSWLSALSGILLFALLDLLLTFLLPGRLAHTTQAALIVNGLAVLLSVLIAPFLIQLFDRMQTTLARQNPYYWRAGASAIEILWPKTLNSEPRENSTVRLAYFKGGLFNRLGRFWVCWGDLRTEHLPESVLKAKLSRRGT